MTIIPWRVKNFVSDRFPLLYHFAANAGKAGNSPEHWDERLAETWDDPSRHWPTKNELVARLTRRDQAILDVGCGTGGILRHLRGAGYTNLHGMEISRYAIERLGEQGIHMHFGMLPSIPLPDGSFDVVIASQVLEHVIRRRRFLREIARVLKPGGCAFIFVPDNCLGPIDEPEHVAKYSEGSLHKLLAQEFSVLSVRSIRDERHPMPILFGHVQNAART